VGCDAHRRYSQFAVLDQHGQLCGQTRVDHEPGAIQAFQEGLPEGPLSNSCPDNHAGGGLF
jgi:hypothetical protein